MYCKECGQHMSENDRFCSICGASYEIRQTASGNVPYLSYAERYRNHTPPTYNAPASGLSMRWYKFLIYCYLFATAAVLILNGFSLLSNGVTSINMWLEIGREFGRIAFVYKAAVVAGLCSLALGVYSIVVRQALARRMKGSPRMLSALFVLQIGLVVAYNAALINHYKNIEEMVSSTVLNTLIQCAEGLILYFCCKEYFSKRDSIFIN